MFVCNILEGRFEDLPFYICTIFEGAYKMLVTSDTHAGRLTAYIIYFWDGSNKKHPKRIEIHTSDRKERGINFFVSLRLQSVENAHDRWVLGYLRISCGCHGRLLTLPISCLNKIQYVATSYCLFGVNNGQK